MTKLSDSFLMRTSSSLLTADFFSLDGFFYLFKAILLVFYSTSNVSSSLSTSDEVSKVAEWLGFTTLDLVTRFSIFDNGPKIHLIAYTYHLTMMLSFFVHFSYLSYSISLTPSYFSSCPYVNLLYQWRNNTCYIYIID
jgi:hypothetical protein